MKNRLWFEWLILGGGLVLIILADTGCGKDSTPLLDQEIKPVVQVQAVEVKPIVRPSTREVAGVVLPAKRAQMGTRQAGTVEAVLVKAGDLVEAGQPILRVDARDLKAARSAAQQAWEAAEVAWEIALRNKDRFQKLYNDNLIAKARLEEANLAAENAHRRLEQAKSELEITKVNLDYAVLRAPFNGFVSEVIAELGSFVAPGPPLVIIEDRNNLEIEATIDQASVSYLSEGRALSLEIYPFEDQIEGRIQAILPALGPSGIGHRLRLLLENPPEWVEPGMTAEIHIPSRTPNTELFSIPEAALLKHGQLDGVFLVEPDSEGQLRARLRWIKPAYGNSQEEKGRVLVRQGLSTGDQVVTGAIVKELSDDQKVKLKDE